MGKKKTKAKKIVISIVSTIVFLLVAVLLLTEIPTCTTVASGCNDHSSFLRECNSVNEHFKDVPLTEISLLGSHDALANDINFTSGPNRSEDNITNNDAVRFFTKGLMVRLARAQLDDAYQQLCAGVRYMDVRITNVGGVFYNSHGLLSNTLEANLLKILKFLYENPGEFLIFDIKDYYLGDSSYQALYDHMLNVKYENKNIFDYINYSSMISEFKNLTYKNITDNGSKAGVVFFAEFETGGLPYFNQFNMDHYASHWHNKTNSNLLIEEIKKEVPIATAQGNDYLRINQAQQTPNSKELWDVFTGWSLLNLAAHHNKRVIDLAEIQDILKALPIYMCDWSTYNLDGFNDSIIQLMKNRNIKL